MSKYTDFQKEGVSTVCPKRATVDVTRNFKKTYTQDTGIRRVSIPHRKDPEYSKEINYIIMSMRWGKAVT